MGGNRGAKTFALGGIPLRIIKSMRENFVSIRKYAGEAMNILLVSSVKKREHLLSFSKSMLPV